MKLLISQTNQIFTLIQEVGLSPSEFKIEGIDSFFESNEEAMQIKHKNSEFYFTFDIRDGGYYCFYSPAEDKYEGEDYPWSWNGSIDYFQKWLVNLKREIQEEDKWERLEFEINNLGFNFDDSNEKFSINEYEEISTKLDSIQESIKVLELTAEQLNRIEESLNHLKASAKNLGKLDWKNLFVGTFLSTIVQMSIPTEVAKSIFNIIKNTLKGLLLT